MGRELKRVPIDFNWPQKQIWKGYLNPYRSFDCMACEKSGYSPQALQMQHEWYGHHREDWVWIIEGEWRYNRASWRHNLTQDDVDILYLHSHLVMDMGIVSDMCRYDEEKGCWLRSFEGKWIEIEAPRKPTAEEVNAWSPTARGWHPSFHKLIEAQCKKLGVPVLCEHCGGKGHIWQSEKIKKLHEKWNPIEPPTGDGYQLWETTSEGSPASPVFATLDELCEWAADNASTFASFKATKDEWKSMLEKNFVHHREGNNVFI